MHGFPWGFHTRRRRRREDEEGEDLPPRITRFPTSSDGGSNATSPLKTFSLEETKLVAALLKLPMSEQLVEIVQEFLQTPTISLVGEAIEARAWIDDSRRNQRSQPTTPAFFRLWLKRERGDYGTGATSSTGTRSATGSPARRGGTYTPEWKQQVTDTPYHTYVLKRMEEVKAKYHQEVAS
jgi:hypothetical protein